MESNALLKSINTITYGRKQFWTLSKIRLSASTYVMVDIDLDESHSDYIADMDLLLSVYDFITLF